MNERPHDLIVKVLEAEAARIVEGVGDEQNFAQLSVKFDEKLTLNRRMAETKSSARKLIRHAGIDLLIVIVRVTVGIYGQRESSHCLLADDERQPFAVSDMLKFSYHNSPRLLIQSLVRPVRIDFMKNVRDAIVLTGEHQMHSDECDMLIYSHIARHEASCAMRETSFRVGAERQQAAIEIDEHLQLTSLESSQFAR